MIIGFFDISLELLPLFKKTARDFPMHDYIFYIDTLNASIYQSKESNDKVAAFAAQGIDYLMEKNCSILVIGNTVPVAYFQNDLRNRGCDVTLITPEAIEVFLENKTDQQKSEIGVRHIHLTKHSSETDLQIAHLLQGSMLHQE